MKLIPRGRTKALLGLALVASSVVAVAPLSNTAQAAAGDPPAGPATITPASGTLTGTFNLSLPAGASCPGDGPAGYRWGTYITPITNDVGGMVFAGSGQPTGQPAFTSALRESPGGQFVSGRTPGLTNGLIPVPLPTFQWLGVAPPAGDYNIGVACTLNNGTAIVNTRYFNTVIRVAEPTPGNFTFTNDLSEAPSAPVIGAVNTTLTSATVNFTQAAATPAVTGYTATVTPTNPAGPALAPIAVGPTATSFEVTGLTTGTEYSVSMIATNSVGDSPASNTVTFVATANLPAIPLTFTAGAGGSGEATISWTIPTPAPTGYTLTVAPAPAAPAPDTYTIAAGASSQTVAGLEVGTVYTFTLQPAYTAPVTGSASTVQGSVNPTTVIQQRITVTRPVGQLILTQRCGVNGDIPAFNSGSNAVPGFPNDLSAIPATASQTGTSPDITPAAPGLPADAVDVDSEFDDYPFPAPPTYPTECGVTLGTSTIVTTGAGAGLYFKADGYINEVTVSDTRDADLGWALNGAMTDFVGINTPANTFDGDWMGWVPSLQNQTPNQTITTGGTVLPGTGVLNAGPGLGSGALLGSAPAGAGLGITQFDARLLMLIPTDTPTDDYVGLLNFTVV